MRPTKTTARGACLLQLPPDARRLQIGGALPTSGSDLDIDFQTYVFARLLHDFQDSRQYSSHSRASPARRMPHSPCQRDNDGM
jgi:hypothetical protein